ESAYRSKTGVEFIQARTMAQRYFRAWKSEEALDRDELSGLAGKSDRSPAEDKKMAGLCDRFEIDMGYLTSGSADLINTVVPQGVNTLKPICQATDSELVARWAVLLLAVLVESHLTHSYPDAQDFDAVLTDEEVENGEVEVLSIRVAVGQMRLHQHG